MAIKRALAAASRRWRFNLPCVVDSFLFRYCTYSSITSDLAINNTTTYKSFQIIVWFDRTAVFIKREQPNFLILQLRRRHYS
jgi:hypothetical protein